jgi:hypothetical protein
MSNLPLPHLMNDEDLLIVNFNDDFCFFAAVANGQGRRLIDRQRSGPAFSLRSHQLGERLDR